MSSKTGSASAPGGSSPLALSATKHESSSAPPSIAVSIRSATPHLPNWSSSTGRESSISSALSERLRSIRPPQERSHGCTEELVEIPQIDLRAVDRFESGLQEAEAACPPRQPALCRNGTVEVRSVEAPHHPSASSPLKKFRLSKGWRGCWTITRLLAGVAVLSPHC